MLGHGWKPWEIDRLDEDQVYDVFYAIRKEHYRQEKIALEVARFEGWIALLPWSKLKSPDKLGAFPWERKKRKKRDRKRFKDFSKRVNKWAKKTGLIDG